MKVEADRSFALCEICDSYVKVMSQLDAIELTKSLSQLRKKVKNDG